MLAYPDAVFYGIELFVKFVKPCSNIRLEADAPTVLFIVKYTVTIHDSADVAFAKLGANGDIIKSYSQLFFAAAVSS
jgi:hypothetical protein